MSKGKTGKPDPLSGFTFTKADPAARLMARLQAEWKRDKDSKAEARALRARAQELDPRGSDA